MKTFIAFKLSDFVFFMLFKKNKTSVVCMVIMCIRIWILSENEFKTYIHEVFLMKIRSLLCPLKKKKNDGCIY